MYDFRKLKNPCGFDEFKHPKFKKDNFSELSTIKRKVNEYKEVLETFKDDQRVMFNEYSKLKKNYEEIEESLNIVASQNKRLVEANKELVGKLYFFKKEYGTRVKKVLFCFYCNSNYADPKLTYIVKEVLESGNLLPPASEDEINCLLLCHRIQLIVRQFAKSAIFSADRNNKTLDKLVNIYVQYLNENVASEKMVINYESVMNDMFSEDVNENVPYVSNNEPFAITIKKIKKSVDFFVPSVIRSENDLSVLNRSSFNENLSNFDARSETFNEEDLLGEITRKLANTIQSANDSFIASETSSLYLFSPKSESSEMLKF